MAAAQQLMAELLSHNKKLHLHAPQNTRLPPEQTSQVQNQPLDKYIWSWSP